MPTKKKIEISKEDCIENLRNEIICRDSLIRQLYSLLDDEPLFSSIFIYGHISTGKSLIVDKVLNYMRYNYSIINCIEHANSRSLLEKILIDLSKVKLTADNNYKLERRCDDFTEFIYQIQEITKKDERPMIVVLEKCDKLRDMDANLLPALLKLNELTKTNICSILTSDVIWDKFKPKDGLYEPIQLHFPQYNKDEIKEILFHTTKPMDEDDTFYDGYLRTFLAVFFQFCNDLKELRYMARKNFEEYVKPVHEGKIKKTNQRALWNNIIKVFKANLEVLYLRVSTDDFEQQAKFLHEIESTTKLALSFELPYYAKYLLIAAFLASYNPAKEDRRLFLKEKVEKKKRKTTAKKKSVTLTLKEGPKIFPLCRLLAIFCAIINSKIDLNAVLLMQVQSLCQLGLITAVGDSNNIDEPKYKCCVDFDFVMVISKNVGFELKNYLCDFLDG
ncbi:hypothetical protein TKK_0003723 [Trichogramma kaykai]|uniref:Origin recognition complex subunit 5 n=1 Tax=Trichogramma kaykai TaxID=54128 RepID=A0ABD2XP78_9HYME